MQERNKFFLLKGYIFGVDITIVYQEFDTQYTLNK